MAIEFIIGKKIGMTRIFDSFGMDFPVTIVEAGPCDVTQIKSDKIDEISFLASGFSCLSIQYEY